MLALDPGPFTLRELFLMVDGWRRERWKHTSAIMWIVAEVNSKKSVPVDRFNPYAKTTGAGTDRPGVKISADNIQLLKCFLPRKAR